MFVSEAYDVIGTRLLGLGMKRETAVLSIIESYSTSTVL